MNNSIGGEQNPTIGKEYNYFITDLLSVNSTITNEISTYIWHIYLKKKNGQVFDITKDGGKIGSEVTYSFSEKAINKQYILIVNRATKKTMNDEYKFEKIAELSVYPKTSKESKIERVILFNKGAKDVNRASYADTLVARAYCIGMVNKEIEFQLWEDDAKGKGHDAVINKNNSNNQLKFKATVNKKGIAETKISLSSNPKVLQNIANKYLMAGDKTEGANHEYYVTASYLGEIKGASQVNVDVANPDYKKTKNEPKKDSAVFPVDKGIKKSDTKNKIKNAYFVNDKNEILKKIIIGRTIKVQLITEGLIGKHIQYIIWEKDGSMFHDEIYKSERIKIPGNICTTGGITITKELFEKGIDLSILGVDPDEERQNYFIEVIPLDVEAESKRFGIDSDIGLLEVEKTKSVAVVSKQPEKKKQETTNGKCKNCEKDITVEELKQVYSKATPKQLEELALYLNKYKKQYKLDTCARKAHFFAQSIQETGLDLVPGLEGEGFNYYWESLISTFGAFQTKDGKAKAKLWGRAVKDRKNPAAIDVSTQDQILIANYAYSPPADKAKELSNTGANDGWNFRGRGLLQITGRGNYKKIQEIIDQVSPEAKVNIYQKYDKKTVLEINEGAMSTQESVLTGLADWYKDKMYLQADETGKKDDDDVVDLIVDIINKHTTSRRERQKHYRKTKVTFMVDNCRNIGKEETKMKLEKKSNKKYDIDKAVDYIINNALSKSKSKCAEYVRKAINAGGINGSWGDAWQYLTALPAIGFSDLGYITEFKKGDIVVFNKVGERKWGHIAMWTGSQWVSDFKQKSIIVHTDYNGQKYRVFRWQ